MPNVDINGTVVEFPDDLSPEELNSAVAQAAAQMGAPAAEPPAAPAKSLKGFAVNAGRDALANAQGQAEIGAYAFPPLAMMKAAQGENIYEPKRLRAIGAGAVAGMKELPKNILKTLSNPAAAAYERPFTVVSDVATLAPIAAGAANLGRMAVGATARKLGPGVFRGTAGIPENLTELALKKPQILETPPVPEAQLNKVVGQPIIAAMQSVKKAIGERFGKIYQRYAGMEGPMQEIVDAPVAQRIHPVTKDVPVAQKVSFKQDWDIATGNTKNRAIPGDMITEKQVVGFKPGEEFAIPRPERSLDDLLVNKNRVKRAFKESDTDALRTLYQEYVGTPKSDFSPSQITAKDKAQILTRVKREAQRMAKFNKAPVTNAPIDTAKDAALKNISTDLDDMRTPLPGGKVLAWADDAWKAVNDIFDTIQSDLASEGKAKDTMMRIARGDNTWLTSGRMKKKVDTIRYVEKLTGENILEPAMEELARQVFSQNMGKGFFPNVVRSVTGPVAGFAAGTGNVPALLGSAASLASTSPKLIGKGIVAGAKAGAKIKAIMPKATAVGGLATIGKVITQDEVRDYLRKAKGDKAKAREMIKKDGYVIPK